VNGSAVLQVRSDLERRSRWGERFLMRRRIALFFIAASDVPMSFVDLISSQRHYFAETKPLVGASCA
jgi:hypothetical protein